MVGKNDQTERRSNRGHRMAGRSGSGYTRVSYPTYSAISGSYELRYGSVCSGVEAASLAWEPLGWEPVFFAEIEKFPAAVLAHRYPNVPNLGDMTCADFAEKAERAGAIDVLVGGTPCQSFSVAGLRGGLDDERGNLALEFCRLADRLSPRYIV